MSTFDEASTHNPLSNRAVHILGSITAIAWIIQTIASYWLAPAGLAYGGVVSGQQLYADMTGIEAIDWLAKSRYWLPLFFLPLVVSSICTMALLFQIMRRPPSQSTVRAVFSWTFVFGVICLPAIPVLAQDFWLSAAWGKMIATGLNPYHQDIPHDIAARWYADLNPTRMTYGPLWAIISGLVMTVSNHPWVVFSLFKAVIAGSWAGALIIVRKMTESLPFRDQCTAIAIVGWMPLVLYFSVSEGHNDIVMAVFALFAFYIRNPIALAASVCIKYVSGPLGLIFLLAREPFNARLLIGYLFSSLLVIACFVLFYRGIEFFDAARAMTWEFLTPSSAVAIAGRPAQWAATAVFPIIAIYQGVKWVKERKEPRRRVFALALLSAGMFAILPHVWPWYLVLLLVFAAVAPSAPLSRWLTGLALGAPFAVAMAARGWSFDSVMHIPDTALYLFALTWLAFTGWIMTSHYNAPRYTISPEAPPSIQS
ncbi:hypothetical protein [Mesorhizobium sp. CAU 1741]|uniref:hypothetical protein n=1 Tax=Mesorhizobium sp. CAU 1741 TaxID=3140366 RepID=UPI00325B180A